ncbi:MAG: PEGA domain-containing protein, partial [Lachnospiraceae bacterium]|nr:PEGA domain-containing protein [Lachnospiraceae bacterium]
MTFLKGKKKLASIKRSPEAWIFDNLDNYDLAGVNRTASIGSLTYALPDEAVVLSEGRRVEKEEVMAQDVVTISGIDHKIYSVKVDKGHGYLRLKNEQPLLGGWIEVGNSVIRQITEDMLLVVPEGSYQVVLSNNGVGCVKEITVERNKEVVLDVGDVEIAEDKTGMILFNVTPESASVSVDGKPVDISKAVEMRYGIHQVQVEASGYDTLTKYIQVGSEYATISFTLEESRQKDNDKNSVSGNTTERIPWQDTLASISGNSISDNTLSTLSENALGTSNNNKVYIDSPKGVEVYLDSNYIGLAPVRFTKSPGRHEITLRKDGYETKSYTIYLANDKKDETYSFSDLKKIGPDDGNSGNSGNSGNNGGNNDDNKGDVGAPPLPPDDSTENPSGSSTETPQDPDNPNPEKPDPEKPNPENPGHEDGQKDEENDTVDGTEGGNNEDDENKGD